MKMRVISLILGYIFGLFPSGMLVGKTRGTDLHSEGSGNTGATNALRVMGWKAGLITLIGDILKAVIPILLVRLLIFKGHPEMRETLSLYAGLGAVLGHDFPIYNIKGGGKGVATTGGTLLASHLSIAAIPLAIFVTVAVGTGYASLGSILGLASVPLTGILFAARGWLGDSAQFFPEIIVLLFVMSMIGIIKHHKNIERLLNGTENRFGHRGKGDAKK